MKKQKGITLISLVVTIIVLIILAGISINLILGQDGIINKAKEAKQNIEYAQIEEQEQLNQLYDQMIGESSGSLPYDETSKLIEFKKQIASAITDMGIETTENADANTMANNIRSLSGASSADKINYDNTNSGLTSKNVQGAIDEVNSNITSLNNSLNGLQLKITDGKACTPFSGTAGKEYTNTLTFELENEPTFVTYIPSSNYRITQYGHLITVNGNIVTVKILGLCVDTATYCLYGGHLLYY